jgi:hypothetical protein
MLIVTVIRFLSCYGNDQYSLNVSKIASLKVAHEFDPSNTNKLNERNEYRSHIARVELIETNEYVCS